MKIALIANPFGEKNPSGLGTSTLAVIKSMVTQHRGIEFEIFVKGEKENKPDFGGDNWKITELPDVSFWLDRYLPRTSDHDAFVFVSTPVMPLTFTPKNSVVVARDFGYLHLKPNNFKHRLQNYAVHFVQKRALKRASGVITISEETKRQAAKYFGVSESRIKVIYNGFTNAEGSPKDRAEEPIKGVHGPFFAYLGVLKERKNVETAIKAFAEFKKIDILNYSFVLAGKKGGEYFDKLQNIVKENDLEKFVVFAGFVTEEQSVYLYRHASAFVYVSLLEGFGKPPLEAMSYGTPTIISDEPPINEVSGPGGYLVNPRDVGAIARAMTDVTTDDKVRDDLIKRGLKRSSEFTWGKTGRRYIQFIQSLI